MTLIGDWRSWLARRVWDAEVGGSSPLSPTNEVRSGHYRVRLGLGQHTNTSDIRITCATPFTDASLDYEK